VRNEAVSFRKKSIAGSRAVEDIRQEVNGARFYADVES
jgi:hypothetical protein